MHHYEIVFIVHPGQSEQVPAIIEHYESAVTSRGGQVRHVEDWGRRRLAYMIQKLAKARYVCLSIECDKGTLTELEHAFKFSDTVLRHLIVQTERVETTPPPATKEVARGEAKKATTQTEQAA